MSINLKTNRLAGPDKVDILNIFYVADVVAEAKAGNLTIDEFIRTIETTAAAKKFSDIPEEDVKLRNKFKGNVFEIFSEIFFNIYIAHPTYGISDYTPIGEGDDFGVDALGINVNGEQCVVQVKYRSDPTNDICYEDVAKTVMAGHWHYGYDLNKPGTVYIITTANRVSLNAERLGEANRKMIVINREQIGRLINNNIIFWKQAYEALANYRA